MPTTRDAGRSRVTATLRLLTALWLMGYGLWAFADPARASSAAGGGSLGALLPLAGLSFALGCFLLTGFMSRVAGLLLVVLSIWQISTLGVSIAPLLMIVIGGYLVLRGGGAWAMDVYVQKMQDRVRQREAASR
jgi:hypothetical protein